MRRIIKNILWVVFLVFILNAAVAVYFLTYDLKTRFPDLDFKAMRFGIASWYSKTDKGIKKHTANNEVFDDRADTCASWDYPFNTRLLVINIVNGKWIVCRVNDRGPAKRLNRAVDLTKAAYKKIANPKRGLTYVAFSPVRE
jgi:rare lipoprotein A (peptidoglycan hydrolase)